MVAPANKMSRISSVILLGIAFDTPAHFFEISVISLTLLP